MVDGDFPSSYQHWAKARSAVIFTHPALQHRRECRLRLPASSEQGTLQKCCAMQAQLLQRYRTRWFGSVASSVTRSQASHAGRVAQLLQSRAVHHANTLLQTLHNALTPERCTLYHTKSSKAHTSSCEALHKVSSHKTQAQLLPTLHNAMIRERCKLCHGKSSKAHRSSCAVSTKVAPHTTQAQLLQTLHNALTPERCKLCHSDSTRHGSAFAQPLPNNLAAHCEERLPSSRFQCWIGHRVMQDFCYSGLSCFRFMWTQYKDPGLRGEKTCIEKSMQDFSQQKNNLGEAIGLRLPER